jgi:hypothetical protein
MLSARSRGQFVVGGIVFLLVLMVIVESMVWYTRREAVWTKHSDKETTAFYLAEAGYNRAQWMLKSSASNVDSIIGGTPVAGYNNDQVYTDVKGGAYEIQITSGLTVNQVIILSTGKDGTSGEFRAIKGVMTRNAGADNFALRANGVTMSGNNFQVDWGPVVSPNAINSGGRTSPFLWSSAGIDLDTNGATPPNADVNSCQWKSWDPDIPAPPAVDLNFYKSSATATGTYFATNQNFTGLNDTTGKTYYVDGDVTVHSPGMYLVGSLIVTGTLTLPNGNWGSGTETVPVPTDAWKQYCANWNYYRSTFDGAAPLTFPGLSSGYASDPALTYTISHLAVHGFVYVGQALTLGNGGGGSAVVGSMLVLGAASIPSNSPSRVFYDPTSVSSLHLTNAYLTQTSWMEVVPSQF